MALRGVTHGADFPDAFRANLWARGLSQDKSAEEALSDFKVECFSHLVHLQLQAQPNPC